MIWKLTALVKNSSRRKILNGALQITDASRLTEMTFFKLTLGCVDLFAVIDALCQARI